MMHRAILGSFERFIGILTENYSGNFPLWLAPIQVVICTITSEADDYAKSLSKSLNNANIRLQLDTRNEQISYKIREHSELKDLSLLHSVKMKSQIKQFRYEDWAQPIPNLKIQMTS